MKLLIVDDEILTRSGLISSLDWESLGIDEVYQAADGIEGFRAASDHKPDIILSDVRMPRMTGIEMLDKVRQILPDTVFIFMSGFSDKDYLKAAIRLQAVSYVEKPLDPAEVADAVREAVSRCRSNQIKKSAADMQDTVSASHLALCFTLPYSSARDSVEELSRRYCLRYGSADLFRAAVTFILHVDERVDLHPDFLSEVEFKLHNFIVPMHLHMVCAEKKPNLFVFHFFRKTELSENTLKDVTDFLRGILPKQNCWHLAVGSTVSGIRKLYDSYTAAVVTLTHSFFHPTNSVLRASDVPAAAQTPDPAATAMAIRAAITGGNEAGIHDLTDRLRDICVNNPALIPGNMMSLYHQLLTVIADERRARQLSETNDAATLAGDMADLSRCFSFSEMHQRLVGQIDRYFADINSYVPENSSVFLIKQYIQQHYDDPMLSTKEISEYASLSASYACTVFKNETGQTLNQFLTEYRMGRAKELLADPRNNISEIASRVGYNDSNYFGKAFKKYAGQSPSEYRDSRMKGESSL
ncbi:MAG: response regulator [Eubacterium sp.]|nr:response regulator [Eubacterium sp.]